MLLYHGTSFERFERIMSDGEIRPRGGGKSNWKHVISHPRTVYLTGVYAGHFGINALPDDFHLTPGAKIALIEIDTDGLTQLVPDEDWLEQSTRTKPNTKSRMRQRTAACRARLHTHLGTEDWRQSVAGMSTCAHLGPIPSSAFTRCALVDIQLAGRWTLATLDALPGVKPYALAGDIHRGLTEEAFSGTLPGSLVRSMRRRQAA